MYDLRLNLHCFKLVEVSWRRRAATVFAALADLEARPAWQAGIVEMRIDPQGPAQPGTCIFEIHKISGHKSEQTLTVSALEQDRHLTIATLVLRSSLAII